MRFLKGLAWVKDVITGALKVLGEILITPLAFAFLFMIIFLDHILNKDLENDDY